jgi:hypothetical protein
MEISSGGAIVVALLLIIVIVLGCREEGVGLSKSGRALGGLLCSTDALRLLFLPCLAVTFCLAYKDGEVSWRIRNVRQAVKDNRPLCGGVYNPVLRGITNEIDKMLIHG